MNLVSVQMCPCKGVSIVLRNFAMGYVALINCLYVLKGPENPRQAKKVASALNKALRTMEWDDPFSLFSAEAVKGEFPVGAKVIDTPLRVATPVVVQGWIKKHLPQPIEASEYDEDAWYQNNHSVVRKYGTFNRALDGELCSIVQ
jgi:hypothetical protein